MPKITFLPNPDICPNGAEFEVPKGTSICKAALDNGFKKMMDNANDLIEKKIISKQELIALTRSIEY